MISISSLHLLRVRATLYNHAHSIAYLFIRVKRARGRGWIAGRALMVSISLRLHCEDSGFPDGVWYIRENVDVLRELCK
jgi:hypothetical protein